MALLLAACGDGDGDGDEAQGDTLDEFLGMSADGADQEAMQADFEAQQREVEEYIAECMADEGFEYVPSEMAMGGMDHPAQELSEDEFREEYGYGITTIDLDEMAVAQTAEDDPNLRIQEELSEAEREAYQEALAGQQPDLADLDPDAEAEAFEPGGCQGEAQQEVQGAQFEVLQELGPQLESLHEEVQADPRYVSAKEDWQGCMSEAGYDYQERFEATTELSQRFNELQGGAADPQDLEQMDELDPDELDELDPDELPGMAEPDPEQLAELQAEELEVAAVEHECSEEHLDEVEQEVREEVEGPFIEENRDLLEEIRPGS